MSSVDTRIKREARLYEAEISATHGRRLSRLQALLVDEVINMLGRCGNSGHPGEPADWLHGKDFNQSYRDFAYQSKQYRTRVRIENLLALCGGDKELLLKEYAVVLEKYFPIPQKRYRWKPTLITRHGRITMLFGWGLRRPS